jgi:hypothetical protein
MITWRNSSGLEKWTGNSIPSYIYTAEINFNHPAILIDNPTEPKEGLRGPKPVAIK